MGEKAQGKGRPIVKTKKRGQAQMEDLEDDEDDSSDELSDGETDASPNILGPKSARPSPHTPKRTKRVSRSDHRPVNEMIIDTSLSQSTNSNQREGQKSNVPATCLPQGQNPKGSLAQGGHQNACVPTRQTQIPTEHDRMLHALAGNQQMPTLNQPYDFQSVGESDKDIFGDNATGGSDSDGLGNTGYGHR